MSRIGYIKSDIFFAKEYNDGIIVAFKKVGDNSPRCVDSINQSFADQIHNVVSKNFGADLFVSDIVDSISGTDGFKRIIRDSLYIYVKHGVSISACGIHSCPNKDSIEVKYNSENVLTIKKKRLWKFGSVCILIVICIFTCVIIDPDQKNDTPDNPDVIPSIISEQKESYITITENKEDVSPVQVEDISEEIVEEKEPFVVEGSIIKPERTNNVETSVEDVERGRKLEEVKERVRIADQAYNDYVLSLEVRDGSAALKYYKQALDLSEKYDLFLSDDIVRIKQCIKVLEKQLKLM